MTGSDDLYDGRYVQGWTFSGSGGDQVSIEVRSADFDSYMYVTGPGFLDPLANDDGAGNLHSRICVELPEDGTYRVLAGPLSGDHAGERYTVQATVTNADAVCDSYRISPAVITGRLAQLPTDGRTLTLGQTLEGFLELGAPRHPEANHPIQAWSFDVQEGRTVYVDVVSEEFDPLLYALGPEVAGSRFVDDVETGTLCNTRMAIIPVASGTLTLLVGSFYEEGSGNFIIRASTDPPTMEAGGCIDPNSGGGTSADPSVIGSISSGESRRIEMGTEVEGVLGAFEETLAAGQPAQPWTIMVQAGEDLVFELISDDFDPILYLDGVSLFTPLMDDDSAGSLDSRIVYSATQNGMLRLVVTGIAEGDSGTFRLRAFRRVN